jgi:hypothetical protein
LATDEKVHGRAKVVEHAPKLDADVAATDDAEALGHSVELEDIIRADAVLNACTRDRG